MLARKPKKKRKRIIVLQSDSSSEEEEVVVKRKRRVREDSVPRTQAQPPPRPYYAGREQMYNDMFAMRD